MCTIPIVLFFAGNSVQGVAQYEPVRFEWFPSWCEPGENDEILQVRPDSPLGKAHI